MRLLHRFDLVEDVIWLRCNQMVTRSKMFGVVSRRRHRNRLRTVGTAAFAKELDLVAGSKSPGL